MLSGPLFDNAVLFIVLSSPFWSIAIAALFCGRADRREAEARDRHPSNYR
jgi:hypothetical protein